MIRTLAVKVSVAMVALACSAGAQEPVSPTVREAIVGGPCQGCSNVFVGLPADLSSSARIAPHDESGEPMVIEGTVTDADGAPAPGIIVYAYHTDDRGIYPDGDTRHGRLRGWAETDSHGRYRFDTIRPAGYPNVRVPAHVHMHVIEPGRCTYFIDDIHFTDDQRITEAQRRRTGRGRGGSGLATPTRGDDGAWKVTRDIVLGKNVRDYEDCERSLKATTDRE